MASPSEHLMDIRTGSRSKNWSLNKPDCPVVKDDQPT
jgi:hypothetical protein